MSSELLESVNIVDLGAAGQLCLILAAFFLTFLYVCVCVCVFILALSYHSLIFSPELLGSWGGEKWHFFLFFTFLPVAA